MYVAGSLEVTTDLHHLDTQLYLFKYINEHYTQGMTQVE